MPAEHVGIDHAELCRREIARQAGQHSSQDKAGKLVAEGRVPERAHALLVDADAGDDATEQRHAQYRDKAQRAQEQSERDEIEIADFLQVERTPSKKGAITPNVDT